MGFSTSETTYAGNNVTLDCAITLNGGITDSYVTVSSMWTKGGVPFSGVNGRVVISDQRALILGTLFRRQLMFSPLSSSMDSATYACVATLTPVRPQFVSAVNRSQSIPLVVQGEVSIQYLQYQEYVIGGSLKP